MHLFAHRGASATHPENTVEAFRAAVAAGADGVELDVWAHADGRLLVHHVELPPGLVPASVPTLDEALDACGDLVVNVEVKRAPAAAVLDGLRDRRRDRLLLSSFDAALMDEVRRLDPAMPTAQLTMRPVTARTIARCAAAGHVALHPHQLSVTARLVARCHDAGLAVNTWTVDDPGRLRQLAAWGVDGVCVNDPAAARRALTA